MFYSLLVSSVYGLLWAALPNVAEAAVVGFVALLLVPAFWWERRAWKNRRAGA